MRGYRGVKYTLFICCYVFWVVSAVLTAVGIYAKIAKENDVVDTLTLDPALLLIVVGSMMFLITILGCFGALRNAPCLLKTVMERTEKLMMKAIVRYREDQDLENAIDFIQKKFQCCGVENFKDWSNNVYFECSDTNPSLEACGVPFSCCVRQQNQTVLNTMCGYGKQRQKLEARYGVQGIFPSGCLEKIVWWAKNNLLLVAGLTGGLLLLEVLMISLAAAQISWIKKVQRQQNAPKSRKTERKDSYWYPAFKDFNDDENNL
ncbi:tetraspanin-33 isoform X2 [Sander lucioperca]|uniref:tetraspanin-33 isoform X2 n=1 Tax=Sander lucioperca TaxID=283035 RepID=UPI00165345D7|nr:tetraspanin-33 isoform X2 [Sander lucioperca]